MIRLSPRQQQLYDVLVSWHRSATAAELSREMRRRYGMRYPVNDLLGALRKKGRVVLVGGEWEPLVKDELRVVDGCPNVHRHGKNGSGVVCGVCGFDPWSSR